MPEGTERSFMSERLAFCFLNIHPCALLGRDHARHFHHGVSLPHVSKHILSHAN
jgi:hypothetical protein